MRIVPYICAQRNSQSAKMRTTTNTNTQRLIFDLTNFSFNLLPKKKYSNSDTLIHLLKGSLGTGILAMPNAFHHAGYLVGAIGTLIIGIVCTYCIHMLLKAQYELCKRKKVTEHFLHWFKISIATQSRAQRFCGGQLDILMYGYFAVFDFGFTGLIKSDKS